MKMIVHSLVAGLLVSVCGLALAQSASKEDAVALAKKAVAHIKKNGIDAACKDFAEPQGGFMQGELYVFVQDMQYKVVCHASNKRMNGKDLGELKDADGKYFVKAMTEIAKGKGSGWVDYQWINPVSKAIEPKSSYIEKVDDGLLLGVGIYRK